METEPQISITMITKNRASFIGAAISSVLTQTFGNWELLVIDGDSKDNTEEIVNSFNDSRITFIKRESTLGISESRNIGLSESAGKYIAVLDSDDTWSDHNKLQKQFDFLEHNLDYCLIGSNIRIVNEKNDFIKDSNFETEDRNIREKILKQNQIPHSTVMYRKELANKINGYDMKLSCVEDLDFFLRLGQYGKFKNLKEMTTAYTKHSGGVSHKRKLEMAWNHYKIVLKNYGKYPNWSSALIFAKLRWLKNLF